MIRSLPVLEQVSGRYFGRLPRISSHTGGVKAVYTFVIHMSTPCEYACLSRGPVFNRDRLARVQ